MKAANKANGESKLQETENTEIERHFKIINYYAEKGRYCTHQTTKEFILQESIQ